MLELLAILVVSVMTGLGLYIDRARVRDRVAGWREAAEVAGLTLTDLIEETPVVGPARLRGRAGSLRVRLEAYPGPQEKGGIRITIEGSSGLTLRRESVGTAVEKALGAREIATGDATFDRGVYVRGAAEMVRAVLDAETRGRLRILLHDGVWVDGAHRTTIPGAVSVLDGDLRAQLPGSTSRRLRPILPEVLNVLLAAARLLIPPRDIARRISENTRHEPEGQVRLNNVLLLRNHYPDHPSTLEALTRACEDESQEVQLEAAAALGNATGLAALQEIASREWADDSVAARAIETLGRYLPVDRALAILASALRTRRIETARASLDVLGHIGGSEVVGPVARVMAIETGELAVAAARALGRAGSPAAEKPLIEALGRNPTALRVAAARALGRAGSVEAVLPLKEAAAATGDGDLRRATRQAIAEIQSRVSGASPGQLSLAEGDAGRLSLADEDPRGRVSLVERREPE